MSHTEKRSKGNTEQARLQVPERVIDSGDRRGADAGPACVAQFRPHRHPAAGNRESVAADCHSRQYVTGNMRRGLARVRIPEARFPAGAGLHQNEGGLVPGVGAVRFGEIGWNRVRGYGKPLDQRICPRTPGSLRHP
ncbi:MAG TPA: hypothetical protein VN428_14730, partial [Bryobacteraceae bacterium]|nr:hypothetical protein [Bryobacteraceae bacterium]